MTERPGDLSDESVRRALHDVADAVRPAPDLADRLLANARAGGPRVVHLESRRHTRWAAPLLAAAVVAVLAVGGVALNSTLADKDTPTTTQAPTNDLAPSPSTSSSPSAPPTSTAPSTPPRSTGRSTPRPAGRSTPSTTGRSGSTQAVARHADLTTAILANARIDMPTWGDIPSGDKCLGGERQFRDGRNALPDGGSPNGAGSRYLELQGSEAVGDVDGDGVDDVTTVVYCGYGDPKGFRVLSFRSKPGGGAEVVGDVTPALSFSETEGRLGQPKSVRSGSRGEVVVRWAASPQPGSATQDRTYRSAGGRFTQVDGPTRFPAR